MPRRPIPRWWSRHARRVMLCSPSALRRCISKVLRDKARRCKRGVSRRLADFEDKLVLLFFGYVHCPDVCPTTLAGMATVVRLLGDDGDRVQGLFVTVDPTRDTPQVLARFSCPRSSRISRASTPVNNRSKRWPRISKDLLSRANSERQGQLHRGPQRRPHHPRPDATHLQLFVGGPRDGAAIAAEAMAHLKE